MQKGLIIINADNRIVNAKTGEELPSMFNRGGMKMFVSMNDIPGKDLVFKQLRLYTSDDKRDGIYCGTFTQV